MQIVELKVNVEKSQLTALEAQVKALSNQAVNIRVNITGANASTLNALAKYNNSLASQTRASASLAAANARVTKSNNDVRIAQEKTAQAMQRTNQSYNRVIAEQTKYNTQVQKGVQQQERLAAQQNRVASSTSKAAKETSGLTKVLGGSVGQVAAQMIAWNAISAAISIPVKAVKEALSTMKEVDSQLVQIQKVTNFSTSQMKEIEEQSYKTASAYGKTADAYLASVASFARGGYKEQSEQLGELSIKTQLVGDTTQEVADQFLLSVDKAYQYEGSVTKLTQVLDGADYINNNYATSIEKIAEGMGIVAPVAAQAHVGVDELMAAIGTVTAVTQRSGSEAARALRALFLNIIGDTKTEIDEGVTWTTGEIAGLQDVLKKFAPDVVAAADAAKTVINPMEAMNALSKAMKEGVLTEQELMEMVSDIGGKLRTSQLLAIIQNWDMYESMLSDYQKAAGTADKEIGYIVDSWEGRLNIMKNTWTEFISNLVETDAIKGAISGITKVIEFLDTGFGQATIKAAALVLALAGVSKAVAGIGKALAGSEMLSVFLSVKSIKDLGAAFSLAGESLAAFFSGPIGMAGVVIAAIVAMGLAVKEATWTIDEQRERVEDLQKSYEDLYGAESEYQQLQDKLTGENGPGNLSEEERKRYSYLKLEADEAERLLNAEKERLYLMFEREEGGRSNEHMTRRDREGNPVYETNEDEITKDVKALQSLQESYDELNEQYKSGEKNVSEYQSAVSDALQENKDYYDLLSEFDEWGIDLTDTEREFLDLYDTMLDLSTLSKEDFSVGLAIENFKGVAEYGEQSVINVQALKKTMEEAGASAEEIEQTIANLRSDDTVILIDVEAENLETTLTDLEELGIAVQDADGYKINVDEFAKLAQQIGLSHDGAQNLLESLGEIDGVDLVDAEGNVADLGKALENVGTPIENLVRHVDTFVQKIAELNGIDLDANVDIGATDDASGTIQTVQGESETLDASDPNVHATATDNASETILSATAKARLFGDMRPNPTLSATDNASSVIQGAIDKLAGFVSKTITLTANYVTTGKGPGGGGWGSGTAGFGGVGRAAGDTNFAGGPVLLGDEKSTDGAPRPELVITPSGKSYLAGMTGPVATTLPAGSRIYPFADTKLILSGQDMTEIQAYAPGNEKILNAYLKTKESQSGNDSGSGSGDKGSGSGGKGSGSGSGGKGGSGSGGKGGSGSSGSSGSSKSSDKDSVLEGLKDELDLLKAQYSYLEASGAEAGELIAKSGEIQNKLHDINERLRSTGGEEKDIVGYSEDWWKELEKIRKATEQVYKDRQSLLEVEEELISYNSLGADLKAEETKELERQLSLYQQGGSVNLLKRPLIDASVLRDVGWEDAGDGKATVFSSTFSNEDGTIAINFTPIIADEDGNFVDVLEPESLTEYAEGVIEGVHEDYLKLQIGGAFTGEDAIAQAEEAAEAIHELHNKYFLEEREQIVDAYELRLIKLMQIQESLHEQAEYLRSIGASQEDIDNISVEWWKNQQNIYAVYEDQRDLIQSEVDLMEKQGRQESARIAKLRQIQDNLHKQAEYMRSIGASQEEINKLSIEWWNIQGNILSIQKDLVDQLDAAVSAYLKKAQKSRDTRVEEIQAIIDGLEKERDTKKETESIEEKQLKVEEARLALQNALNEKTVRYYNAETGQWEYRADASNVKSARESLKEAQEALKEEQEEQEYERLVREYENQITAIKEEYESLESRWDSFMETFDEPLRDITDILGEMQQQGLLSNEQLAMVKDLVGDIEGYTNAILQTFLSYTQYKQENPSGNYISYYQYITGEEAQNISRSAETVLENGGSAAYRDSSGNVHLPDGTTIAAGSNILGDLDEADYSTIGTSGIENYEQFVQWVNNARQKYLAEKANGGGTASSGTVTNAVNALNSAKDSLKNGDALSALSQMQSLNKSLNLSGVSGASGSSSSGGSNTSSGTATSPNASSSGATKASDKYINKTYSASGGWQSLHDEGGVLTGKGGIKGTDEDEIVLPPELARKMLTPDASRIFEARMQELGYVYGATNVFSNGISPSLTTNSKRSSNDHYGDVYRFGDVVLTEEQAKGTTIYELARISRSLGVYSARR